MGMHFMVPNERSIFINESNVRRSLLLAPLYYASSKTHENHNKCLFTAGRSESECVDPLSDCI